MTDDEINRAIALFCGWVELEPFEDSWSGKAFTTGIPRRFDGSNLRQTIPDYANDLNEIHKAEKTLRPIRAERYYRLLIETVGSYELAISANARQRAEAFLRTFGKWE